MAIVVFECPVRRHMYSRDHKNWLMVLKKMEGKQKVGLNPKEESVRGKIRR